MYLLMYLLDLHHFWIFENVLKEILNKICKLMCSVFFVDNDSCDNKTLGFGLFINSCYLLDHLMDFLDS